MGDLRERIRNIIESDECGREILKTVYKPYWMRFWLSKKSVIRSGGIIYYDIALDVEYNDVDNYGTDMTPILYANKPQTAKALATNAETIATKIENAISSYLQFKETLNIMGLIRDNQKSLPNGTGHQIITVHLPNGEDKIIDIPKGCYDFEDPYNIIGNYIEENMNKDFPEDIPSVRDCLVVMSRNKNLADGYFYDLFRFENNIGRYVWEHDWWEGEDFVQLIDYKPIEVIADEMFESWEMKNCCCVKPINKKEKTNE